MRSPAFVVVSALVAFLFVFCCDPTSTFVAATSLDRANAQGLLVANNDLADTSSSEVAGNKLRELLKALLKKAKEAKDKAMARFKKFTRSDARLQQLKAQMLREYRSSPAFDARSGSDDSTLWPFVVKYNVVNPANPLGIGGAEIKEMIAGVQHTVNRINRVLDASKNNRLVKKFFEPKLAQLQKENRVLRTLLPLRPRSLRPPGVKEMVGKMLGVDVDKVFKDLNDGDDVSEFVKALTEHKYDQGKKKDSKKKKKANAAEPKAERKPTGEEDGTEGEKKKKKKEKKKDEGDDTQS